MEIKVIKTEAENKKALKEIEKLMLKPELTKSEENRLELLYVLVENFERTAYPLPTPDPIEAIKYFLESQGYTKADLVKELGDRSKASQVLNRKRGLSLTMIRNLVEHWHIPAEILLKPYELDIPARRRTVRRLVTA